MEFGSFTIFQFNGKDCFLHAADDRFTLLSFCEIPSDLHQGLKPGRKLDITSGNHQITESNLSAGMYRVASTDSIYFRLAEFEDDEAVAASTKIFILESRDGKKGIMFEHGVRPVIVPYLKEGREVEIGDDGRFKFLGVDNRKPGTYLTLSWVGIEGALTAPGELIIVSQAELAPELHGQLYPGHQILITDKGEIRKTDAERHRHTQILAGIAALEGSGDNTLPAYAQHKLQRLRVELRGHEPHDPSAVTAEHKRANSSLDRKDFKLFKGCE